MDILSKVWDVMRCPGCPHDGLVICVYVVQALGELVVSDG